MNYGLDNNSFHFHDKFCRLVGKCNVVSGELVRPQIREGVIDLVMLRGSVAFGGEVCTPVTIHAVGGQFNSIVLLVEEFLCVSEDCIGRLTNWCLGVWGVRIVFFDF